MKRGKILVTLFAVAALVFSTMPGHAAGDSDSTTTVFEPILVKADAQVPLAPFRTNQYPEADIRSFNLTATGGVITASITTAAPLPQTPAQAAVMAPPYGGVHIMVHFQTANMAQATGSGCAQPPSIAGPCPFPPAIGQVNNPVVWVPMFAADRQFLALGYGVVLNEEDNDSWVARYDPSGRIAGAAPAGQVWSIQGQRTIGSAAATCPQGSASSDGGDLPTGRGNSTNVSFAGTTLNITTPYLYKWRTAPPAPTGCLKRSKQLVDVGEVLSNAVAFSWLDHEIGGPEPVGLILGWTWYTDSVPGILGAPKNNVASPGWTTTDYGYKVGTPAGDPNVAAIADPTKCPLYVRGFQVIPPSGPPVPCMIANSLIGPGFNQSNINVTAS